ncbi:MAG: hypothetical protein ACJ8FT_07615 [Sphingomonas sp.]
MNFGPFKARIAEQESDERRRSSRLPVTVEGKMRELGTNGVQAQVLNTERGFMAVTKAHFAVGSRVWLMLPGRDRANAVIKWTVGDKIGAEFAEPVTLATFTA